MRKLRLSITIYSLLCMLVLGSNLSAQERPPILERVAKTYGVDSWNQIEAVRYSFHIEFGAFNVSRSWEWEPKTTKVSYEGKDKDGKPVRATYLRSELTNQPDNIKNEIDPAFINDSYTLFFPLRAYWDTSAAVIDQGMFNLPTGSGAAELITVKYPAGGGGYTPGDTWELFASKDGRVEYWVYHRGGATKPSVLLATWGDQKKAGPLLLSTDRRGSADGKPIRIFFSNVSVKLTGSDKWINAQ